MGLNHFEKEYQQAPIKIGMSIAIASGFVFPFIFLPKSVSGGFSFSRLLYRGKVAPSFSVRSGHHQARGQGGVDFKGFYVDFDGFWAGCVPGHGLGSAGFVRRLGVRGFEDPVEGFVGSWAGSWIRGFVS